jgi:putative transposon-encoded protein
VALDLNGDGRAELAVYRRESRVWFAIDSLDPFNQPGTILFQGERVGFLPVTFPTWMAGTTTGDLDGDRRADLTLFRPSTAEWLTITSTSRFTEQAIVKFGLPGDVPVPGDYLGFGREQRATYRPTDGSWRIAGSPFGPIVWGGMPDDRPVPADYDGDRRTDIAVWRESTGVWHVLLSSLGYTGGFAAALGEPGDIPVPAAYLGDRRAVIAVFRPSTGHWLVSGASFPDPYGVAGDIPVPGEYSFTATLSDRTDRASLAVFRPSTGRWHFTTATSELFGAAGDIPAPADFNGDGTLDLALFRPSSGMWFVSGMNTLQPGMPGDIPLPRIP